MREFAEQEIVLPSGPHAGRRLRIDRQPCTGLLFDEIDSGRWRRIAITGPTQSSKTLSGSVIPTLYHLFEIGETVIFGLPHMDMAKDKWQLDLLPVIEKTRYRDLLPSKGEGSRGGEIKRGVQFKNGAVLRFMSGGGDDKKRSAFTTRVAVITETDGMDEPGGASREGDKIAQIEARTSAFGSRARIYMECTVSIETGRIWQEFTHGSQSRIVCPCPHCRDWVTPEREHLIGWQDATNLMQAKANARIACPSCGAAWSEDERIAANAQGNCKLLHHGQEIDSAGEISGELPQTDTLGFRWNTANNCLIEAPAEAAAAEFRKLNAPDEDNVEKEICQFKWAVPHKPSGIDLSAISPGLIESRIWPRNAEMVRGHVPPETWKLTAAVDLGKRLLHWITLGFSEQADTFIIDYGRIEVASDELGEERALMLALREFREMCELGWAAPPQAPPQAAPPTHPTSPPHTPTQPERRRVPDQVFIDSGWMPDVAYAFCEESQRIARGRYRPTKSYGAGQMRSARYNQPKQTGAVVKLIGDAYHISQLKDKRTRAVVELVEINADRWKSWGHARIATPPGQPGSFTLFTPPANQPRVHLAIAKHLTSEKQVQDFEPRQGHFIKWENIHANNHWFDGYMLACCAGHLMGVRLLGEVAPPQKAATRPRPPAPKRDWITPRQGAWV